MEVKVKEIKIDLGNRELILSFEEAEQLKRVLDDLFQKGVKCMPVWIEPYDPRKTLPWYNYKTEVVCNSQI